MQLINLVKYDPEQSVKDIYPQGTLFLAEQSGVGRDWYAHRDAFDKNKLKVQVDEIGYIVCVSNDITTLNPINCSVYECDALILPEDFELSKRWKFINNAFVIDVDIDDIKYDKYEEIARAYNKVRAEGFESSALGTVHKYRGDERGQAELNSIVIANIDIDYRCIDENGVKARRHHTAAQIKNVFQDGVIILRDINDIEDNLYAAVESAVDAASIDAIVVNF